MTSPAAFPGPDRFDFFLAKVDTLLQQAVSKKNPALWLYQNNFRTPLFMLEGLCKLYAGLHNEKKFSKIKEQVKLVEDLLGAIDYYDHSAIELAKNNKIPATFIKYLKAQTREKIESLNELLIEKKWLNAEEKRTDKIRRKLADAKWMKAAKELSAIASFYGESVYAINEFVQEKNGRFTQLETEVHELRRRLRWLSIYPQALNGAIQLSNDQPAAASIKKYLTKNIVTSPFNQMPEGVKGQPVLMLRKNQFLALSWMINELGRIKDSGLQVMALTEAMQQSDSMEEAAAMKKSYALLGKKQLPIPILLEQAAAVCRTFFDEQHLEHLVQGTSVQP